MFGRLNDDGSGVLTNRTGVISILLTVLNRLNDKEF